MGCDIHVYREKFVDGSWRAADEWEAYDYGDDEKGVHIAWEKRAYTGRNYVFFGVLSKGVRGHEFEYSFEARGTPFDCSQQVKDEICSWGSDGHSHSYLYLHELKALHKHLSDQTVCISGMKDKEGWKALQESIASGKPNWELLYPYCQWASNAEKYESFSIDVPASFYVGNCLETLINSFDGIDGDNQRLVFFFDN